MKRRIKYLLGLAAVLLCIGLGYIYKQQVLAADVLTIKDFYIVDTNGDHIHESGSFPMYTNTKKVYLMKDNGLENVTILSWSSSNDELIEITPDPANEFGVILNRKGPGYARITCEFKVGNVFFALSALVEVPVEIKDENNAGVGEAYTPLTSISTDNERAIILNYCSDPNFDYSKFPNSAEIIVKYAQNQDVVKNEFLSWKSSDETVVKVDANGNVTAVGAGRAKIHITTNTLSTTGKPMELVVNVLVNPLINTNVYGLGKDEWVNEGTITVGSSFSLQTNAMRASNLRWVVKDLNGNVLDPDSKQFSYVAHNTSGNFEVVHAKVGVYNVEAFIQGLTAENAVVKYLKFTVIVPYQSVGSITMNVTDTYDLVENLNMGTGFTRIESSDNNIVSVNQATGVITAKSTGTATVKVWYKKFENGVYIDTFDTITVNVIDALALNLSDATITVKGTVQLDASVTDKTALLKWESSNPAVATVDSGLVTGISPGTTVITVSTVIGGVYKSATCNILVVSAVTNITIDPSSVDLSIGEYKTLTATVTPNNLNTVNLKWLSSNEAVVQIVETGKKYVTIKALQSGRAVITAINQDNIVVGFCEVTVRQPVTSISLSETNVVVSLSAGSFQLRATVLPANATNQNVKYTSTNTTVIRVDSEGKVTLVGSGSATIIVTSEDTPSVSAICNVTVTTPVTGIELDTKNVNLVVGETYRLTYTILPMSATNKQVTFSTSNNRVCSVNATGQIYAVAPGSAIVTITSVDGKYTQSASVTVTQFATSIKLEKTELTLNVGENYTIKVTTTPAATNDLFDYEISNKKVATVSSTGVITAKAEGTAIVIVKTNRGLTAFLYLTVKQQANGIMLNYSTRTVVVTNTFKLKATVLPTGASNQKVTYKSSNSKIAKVSASGTVTGVKGGTAIITVTSVDGGYTATCIVTVKELITSIKVKNTYLVKKGKNYTISPTIKTNSATNTKLQWSSSNTKIVTVDKKGVVTAKNYGKAKITIKATDGSGAKATCTVQVIRPVKSISLNKAVVTVVEGNSFKLTAKVNPSNATYNSVTWSSSDESVAIVDSKGKVTAIKPGNVVIYAKSKDSTNKKAKCVVTVIKKVPSSSITVANQTVVMVKGESKTIQAVMNPANTTDGYKWSSDNTAVASVDKNTGRIVAKAIGTATITVMTDSGKTAKITVNVVGLSKSSLTLEQYTSHTLWVDGNTSNITWDIENPNIATVSNGKVTARMIGKTKIIATVNGRKLYCNLTVTKIR